MPNKGTITLPFYTICKDQYGSELENVSLKWSLLDSDGNSLTDSNITIDENTGILSIHGGAAADGIKIKVEAAENPSVYAVSDVIPTYKMVVANVKISGDSYIAVPKSGSVTKNYKVEIFDQKGRSMPTEELDGWKIENCPSNIEINAETGDVTVNAGAADAVITVEAAAGSVSDKFTADVYNPVVSKITVLGSQSIKIPENTTEIEYTAPAADKYGNKIDTDGKHYCTRR